jgi:hypothetical protein
VVAWERMQKKALQVFLIGVSNVTAGNAVRLFDDCRICQKYRMIEKLCTLFLTHTLAYKK